MVTCLPSEPVRVAETHRPRSSREVAVTDWAHGPTMARSTPPGFHGVGALAQDVAVIKRTLPKCCRNMVSICRRMSPCRKSMLGSEIAMALGRLVTRLVHSECHAQKSSATESPFALADQTRNRSGWHLLKVSPMGELGAWWSGGGRGMGPAWCSGVVCGGRKASQKSVCQASFRREA
jgi:hypothetical protein